MTGGLLGPIFLLAPAGLWAMREPQGRSLLVCALVFLLPYRENIGTRFLIPALPLIALAMGIQLVRTGRFWATTLLLAHGVLSSPWAMSLYSSDYAWRLSKEVPQKAALRLQSEESWLVGRDGRYAAARMVESHVPSDARVFSFSQQADSYTSRSVHVAALSAQGESLLMTFFAALLPHFQPSYIEEFSLPEQPVSRLRAVQTAFLPKDSWSIHEFTISRRGHEIPRLEKWHLRASVNPWEIQRAFDNNLTTAWSSWSPARPGMTIELDLREPTILDSVRLQGSADQSLTKVRLEALNDFGVWIPLTGPDIFTEPMNRSLRRDAIAEFKRLGFHYLLINKDNEGFEDMRSNRSSWGVKTIDERDGTRLYQLE